MMAESKSSRISVPSHVFQLTVDLAAQQQMPEKWLRGEALRIGVLVLAASRPVGDDGTYGGINGERLASLLRPHVAAALDFLAQHNETPALRVHEGAPGMKTLCGGDPFPDRSHQEEEADTTPSPTTAPDPPPGDEDIFESNGQVDTSAAASLKSMGVEEL
jgi:hypothetical protein